VQKLDPLTVVFTTKDVSAPFLQNLTLPLLPEHAWKGVAPENFAASPLNLKPLGSGAFAIREVEKNSDGSFKRMTLASFAGSPKNPKLDAIVLVFYNSNEELRQGYLGQEVTTVGMNAGDSLTGLSEEQAMRSALPQYQAVFLNVKSPAFSDPSARTALRMITNSKKITESAWGNRARPITIPPLGLVNDTIAADPTSLADAEVLLNKNGWIKQASGVRSKGAVRLNITLLTSDSPSFRVADDRQRNTHAVHPVNEAFPIFN
jgi:peptide/nickel transport system substrate-binding protein